MKLWYVKTVDPKPKDRRRAWFFHIYTVHAKTALGARADVEDRIGFEVRFRDKPTIVSVKECDSTIVDIRIFDATDKDLRK